LAALINQPSPLYFVDSEFSLGALVIVDVDVAFVELVGFGKTCKAMM
jgi:hypothetical protein